MSTAISHHLQKSATAVLVLKMLLEVLRELVYALAQYSNLDLRRPGVLVVDGGFLDGCRLLSLR